MPAIAIPAAAKAALDTDFMVISVLLQWTNLETDPSIKLDLQTKCGRGVGCEITMRSSRSEGHSPFQDGDFAVPKGGESEQLVGMAIAGRRDDVIRATKATLPMRQERNHQGSSRRWLVAALAYPRGIDHGVHRSVPLLRRVEHAIHLSGDGHVAPITGRTAATVHDDIHNQIGGAAVGP